MAQSCPINNHVLPPKIDIERICLVMSPSAWCQLSTRWKLFQQNTIQMTQIHPTQHHRGHTQCRALRRLSPSRALVLQRQQGATDGLKVNGCENVIRDVENVQSIDGKPNGESAHQLHPWILKLRMFQDDPWRECWFHGRVQAISLLVLSKLTQRWWLMKSVCQAQKSLDKAL